MVRLLLDVDPGVGRHLCLLLLPGPHGCPHEQCLSGVHLGAVEVSGCRLGQLKVGVPLHPVGYRHELCSELVPDAHPEDVPDGPLHIH